MIENMVLGRIFVPKRDEVTGVWRKLNNEEINDPYSSQIIIWLNIPGRMRWVGNVLHMEYRNGVYRVWWENRRVRDHLEEPGVDERIIFKWIFRKWDMGLEVN